jgi:hypothetical protein
VAATSVDYPGSLLDVRHRISDDVHEVERAIDLAAAAGFPLPAGDDTALRVRRDPGGARLAPAATTWSCIRVRRSRRARGRPSTTPRWSTRSPRRVAASRSPARPRRPR